MVTYFAVDGIPGQYFSCGRYGTMSVSACNRNFTAAPQAVKSGRLEGCVGCSIGAQHVGAPAASAATLLTHSFSRSVFCVRCRRSGSDPDSRLIGRMRLVRCHTICVSCYNREREVLHGKNGKGARPKKWAGLHTTRIAKVVGNSMEIMQFAHPVFDCLESVLTILRHAPTESPSVGWTASDRIEKDRK